jgi:hypothetical protein
MDNGVDKKVHNKIAKGKKLFTTQLPIELADDLREFSEKVGIPMTILVEKFIQQGLEKSKRTGEFKLFFTDEENN